MKKRAPHPLVSLFLALGMLVDSSGAAFVTASYSPQSETALFSEQALSAAALGQLRSLSTSARIRWIQWVDRVFQKAAPPRTEPSWRSHPEEIPAFRAEGERLWRAIRTNSSEAASYRADWNRADVENALAHRGNLVLDRMALVWPQPGIHLDVDPILGFPTPVESATPDEYLVIPLAAGPTRSANTSVYVLNEDQVEKILLYLAGREDARLAIARLPTMPQEQDDVLPTEYWKDFYGGPEEERPRYHFDLETRPFIREAILNAIRQMPETKDRPFTLLHAGAGKGEILRQIQEDLHREFPRRRFQLIGFDLNAAQIGAEGTEGDLTLRTASATDDQAYPAQSIDLLLDTGLMSHGVVSRAQAVRAIGLWAKHLAPGGLIVSVPFTQSRLTEIPLPANLRPRSFSLPERIAAQQRPWVFITLQKVGGPDIPVESLLPAGGTDLAESRMGQKVLSGEGFTPAQARAVAARLEARRIHKPRRLSPQELFRIANRIERLAKDNTRETNRILKKRLGSLLYYKYIEMTHFLRELAEHPDLIVMIDQSPYRVVWKSVPGIAPFEYQTPRENRSTIPGLDRPRHTPERVWSFPLYEPPLVIGEPGLLTIYIQDVEDFDRDPSRLDGIIHGSAEYILLPRDISVLRHQRHSVAFLMEGLAGGEILHAGNPDKETVMPGRVEREMDQIPGHLTHLKLMAVDAFKNVTDNFRPRTGLLRGVATSLERIQVEVAERTRQRLNPQSKVPVETPRTPAHQNIFSSGKLDPRNLNDQRQAAEYILERQKEGCPFVEIYSGQNGPTDVLPPEDALLAAREGFLYLDTIPKVPRLFWGLQARMIRLGDPDGLTYYPQSFKIPFTGEAIIVIGAYRFTFRTELNEKSGAVEFKMIAQDKHVAYPIELDEPFSVGRIRGDHWDPDLKDLEPIHFAVHFTRTKAGGYELEVTNLSERGLLLEWVKAPTQGQGTGSIVSFMGTGHLYYYISRMGTWAWQCLRNVWARIRPIGSRSESSSMMLRHALDQEDFKEIFIPELARSIEASDHLFSPLEEQTRLFSEFIFTHQDIFAGQRVLELGTGTGVLGLLLLTAQARQVVAVDLMEKAVVNANRNLKRFSLEFQHRILIGQSDLYQKLPTLTHENFPRFDRIVFNHPIRAGRRNGHIPPTLAINSGPDFEVNRQAVAGLPALLNPGGSAYFWVAMDALRRADFWSPELLQASLPPNWTFEGVEGPLVYSERGVRSALVRIFERPDSVRTSEASPLFDHHRRNQLAQAA